MNFKNGAIAIICILSCTVIPIAGIFAYDAYLTRDITAEIKARAPELGNFTPNKVTVLVGEKVKLRVRNVDTVTHGFAMPELGVDAGEIKAGEMVTLEFTPEETGTYDFYCTQWCSEHHLQMRGTFVVVEQMSTE